MADLKQLNRRRGNLKTQLSKLESFLHEPEDKEEGVLTAKLNSVSRNRQLLEDLKKEYYAVADDTQMVDVDSALDKIDEDIEKLEVGFQTLLFNCRKTPSSNISETVNCSSKSNCIKLPAIQLPKFDGKHDEWFNFKNQFLSIIDNQKYLDDNQKLFYLQSCLLGIAKQVQTQDDTYSSLLDALTNRFENKRLIVNSHINALLFMDKIRADSAKDLRFLIDNLLKNIRALKLLKLETNELTEALLINLIVNKLDHESRKAFEMSLTTKELPSWTEFIEFLHKRYLLLESINHISPITNRSGLNRSKSLFVQSNSESKRCLMCKKSHELQVCPSFLELSPNQRFEEVKRLKLCINCLRNNHKLSNCFSKCVCDICKGNHHKLLHFPSNSFDKQHSLNASSSPPSHGSSNISSTSSAPLERDSQKEPKTFSASSFENSKCILLSTAIIYLHDASGNIYPCRGLLDNGSMNNFLSYKASQMLNMKPTRINVSVSSINDNLTTVKSKYTATISNSSGNFQRTLDFYSVPKITDLCPARCLDVASLNIPQNIILADPNFYKPSKIDVLLGAEVFFDLLKEEKLKINNLSLMDTHFGFVVSGIVSATSSDTPNTFYCGFLSEQKKAQNETSKQLHWKKGARFPYTSTNLIMDCFCDDCPIRGKDLDSTKKSSKGT